jgi:hypothetical protein
LPRVRDLQQQKVVVQLEEEVNRMDRIVRIKAEVLLFLYPVHPVYPVNSFLLFKLTQYPAEGDRPFGDRFSALVSQHGAVFVKVKP